MTDLGIVIAVVLSLAAGTVQAQPSLFVLQRPYHRIALAKLATTTYTHVEVVAYVTSVRKQQDGDVHLTLSTTPGGQNMAVAETTPTTRVDLDLASLSVPRVGWLVRIWGISRYDRAHRFAEIHPIEGWRRVLKGTP